MDILQHISTYVLLYHSLLFITNLFKFLSTEKSALLFSNTFMLHLNIITIMFMVPQCDIQYIHLVILFKFAILIICYIKFRKNMNFSLLNTVPSIFILIIYISLINYDKVYDCDIDLIQIILSSVVAFVIYIIIMLIENNIKNKEIKDENSKKKDNSVEINTK